MRALVQRVARSRVTVDGEETGATGQGLMILLGVGLSDGPDDARYLADKVANLRVFEDGEGKMNLSVADTGGEIMVVSQFTLYGDCRKGRRPSYAQAAPPAEAERLYEYFVGLLREQGFKVSTGKFQAMMMVEIINDGPVTLMLDSKKAF